MVLTLIATCAHAGDIEGTVTVRGRTDTVIVYVDGPGPVSPSRAVVQQKDKRFVPGAAVVTSNAMVEFANNDKVFHHVFSLTPGAVFEIEPYRSPERQVVPFRAVGEVDIYCNMHETMSMRLLVVPNDWYVSVDEGRFTLRGVAAGTHDLVAWSPDYEPQRFRVDVPESGTVVQDFSLERRRAVPPHPKPADIYP